MDRLDRGARLLGAAVGAVGLLLLLAAQVHQSPQTAELYSPSHSEVATFRSVWNSPPSGSVLHPGSDGLSVERPDPNEPPAGALLCGIDGADCPALPSFNGEDYFDDKPLGCCNTPEQQAIWAKWTALKNRVAGMEATVRYLQGLKNEVNLDYTMDEAKRGEQGKRGRAGPQGPVGGLGSPGEMGPPGIAGAQGQQGGMGARGANGVQGLSRSLNQGYQGALTGRMTPMLRAVQRKHAMRREAQRRSIGTFQDEEDAHVPLPLS